MIPFEKWHGADNDFVVIDAREFDPRDRRAFGRRVCDRETGIGADGVLLLTLGTGDPPRVEMVDVQPDGSLAEMCGNGARVAAKWAAVRTGCDEVIVETTAGDRRARIDGDTVTVEMGRFSFDPDDIPLDGESPLVDEPIGDLVVTAVDTGVPHAVAFVEEIETINLDAVAPPVRHAAVFPEGANVTLAEPMPGGFRQRTYERGVEGETRACGTGAVAIAAAAYRRGLIDAETEVRVTPPGGDLWIIIHADGTATLRGPVAKDFDGEIEAAPG